MRARISPRSRRTPGIGAWLAGLAIAVVLSGATVGAPDSPGPPPDAAAASIEELHEVLLEVMKNAGPLGFSGRLERIRPVLGDLYDFPFMAEKSVGLGWRQLDDAARSRLVDAFSRLAISTYAARFDGYDGDRFETLGVQPASHGTVLVKTRIVRGSGETVALDYRMRAEGDRWRIIDVFLNGTVSELALRRSEYSGVLKRQGFDALLQAIEQKIAAQERGADDARANAQP
ncbi:MAG TPA: ABC transporter substrate-binding protein [Myxococcota bacterium]|nr:ABC transporter substrate-binding protein [Myxococcota bacterium]